MIYKDYKDLDAVALENNKLAIMRLMVELTGEVNNVLALKDNATVEKRYMALRRFIAAFKEDKA